MSGFLEGTNLRVLLGQPQVLDNNKIVESSSFKCVYKNETPSFFASYRRFGSSSEVGHDLLPNAVEKKYRKSPLFIDRLASPSMRLSVQNIFGRNEATIKIHISVWLSHSLAVNELRSEPNRKKSTEASNAPPPRQNHQYFQNHEGKYTKQSNRMWFIGLNRATLQANPNIVLSVHQINKMYYVLYECFRCVWWHRYCILWTLWIVRFFLFMLALHCHSLLSIQFRVAVAFFDAIFPVPILQFTIFVCTSFDLCPIKSMTFFYQCFWSIFCMVSILVFLWCSVLFTFTVPVKPYCAYCDQPIPFTGLDQMTFQMKNLKWRRTKSPRNGE